MSVFLFAVKEALTEYPKCVNSLIDLTNLHLVAIITSDELRSYSQAFFINNGTTAKEFDDIMKQIRFRMWEIEFEETKMAEQKLWDLLIRYNITPEAMKTIIQVFAMNQLKFYQTLLCIWNIRSWSRR